MLSTVQGVRLGQCRPRGSAQVSRTCSSLDCGRRSPQTSAGGLVAVGKIQPIIEADTGHQHRPITEIDLLTPPVVLNPPPHILDHAAAPSLTWQRLGRCRSNLVVQTKGGFREIGLSMAADAREDNDCTVCHNCLPWLRWPYHNPGRKSALFESVFGWYGGNPDQRRKPGGAGNWTCRSCATCLPSPIDPCRSLDTNPREIPQFMAGLSPSHFCLAGDSSTISVPSGRVQLWHC